jgi:hypothetical protein
MKPRFIFQGHADGATIHVEVFPSYFTLSRVTNLESLTNEPGRILVDGVSVSHPEHGTQQVDLVGTTTTAHGSAMVRATLTSRRVNFADVNRLCRLTWNDRPVEVRVVRAPWFACQPLWLRWFLCAATITPMLLSPLLPVTALQPVLLFGPLVVVMVMLRIPKQFTPSDA